MSSKSPRRAALIRVEAKCDHVDSPAVGKETRTGHSPANRSRKLLNVPKTRNHATVTSDKKITPKHDGKHHQAKLTSQDSVAKSKTSETFHSHVNSAFQNDDGTFSVTDDKTGQKNHTADHRSNTTTHKGHNVTSDKDGHSGHNVTCDKDGHSDTLKLKRTDNIDNIAIESEVLDSSNGFMHLEQSPQLISSATSITVLEEGQGESRSGDPSSQSHDTTADKTRERGTQLLRDLSPVPEQTTLSTVYSEVSVDNITVVPMADNQRETDNWVSRSHSRSVSSADSTDDLGLEPQTNLTSVQRSYSMRLPSTNKPVKPKSRSLLRDLSFSDSDAKSVRNYGMLRGGQYMPRRKPTRHAGRHGDCVEDTDTGVPVQMLPEFETHLMHLMQELLARGKVRQVAVLEQENGAMLVSLPPWILLHKDAIGLIKSVSSTIETIVKLSIGREMYTFFKHGRDKVMGRSGDSILVAQRTDACLVVGVADDNTPGSCLYEVSELARALKSKGW
uniref:Profilin n=1 Tax=Arion vulgaris TaxID=1028688 RepID=A0A0B7ASL2_9EUPU